MLSDAYTAAKWVEYIAVGLALVSVLAIAFRLRSRPRQPVLGAVIALVVSVALGVGSSAFQGTEVVRLRLNTIKQIGLEFRHDGMRTNAVLYAEQVSVTATLKAPGVLGTVVKALVHKTTNVNTQVAVYGLIDFATIGSKVATVDRQAHTITLALPEPTISQNTTYISAVNGVQQQDGPLTAIAQGVVGVIESLFHLPIVSVNPEPELALAETRALRAARHSAALRSCGEEEIVRQLTGIFHLLPAYRGYTVHVSWPTPPDATISCAALQRPLTHSSA